MRTATARQADPYTDQLDEFAEAWATFWRAHDPGADEDDSSGLNELLDFLIMANEFAESLPPAQRRRWDARIAHLSALTRTAVRVGAV